jgi:hypothetical protein
MRNPGEVTNPSGLLVGFPPGHYRAEPIGAREALGSELPGIGAIAAQSAYSLPVSENSRPAVSVLLELEDHHLALTSDGHRALMARSLKK